MATRKQDASTYPMKEIVALIERERLPAEFEKTVREFYRPAAMRIAARQDALGRQLVVGVSGPQGSGKSTFAKFLGALLTAAHKTRVALLSLDDIYLTKNARETLARDIHPLLATRGRSRNP